MSEHDESREVYLSWESRMSLDRHGGQASAAALLGVTPDTIGRWRSGEVLLTHRDRLALTALALGAPPWSADWALPAAGRSAPDQPSPQSRGGTAAAASMTAEQRQARARRAAEARWGLRQD